MMSFRSQRGQSLAEFALVVPIWIVLVITTIQLCMLMQASFFTRQAVQSAARVFAVRQDQGEEQALEFAKKAAARVANRMRPQPTDIEIVNLPLEETHFKLPRDDDPIGPDYWRLQLNVKYPLLFSGSTWTTHASTVVSNERPAGWVRARQYHSSWYENEK